MASTAHIKKSRAIVFTWDLEIGTTYCALFTTPRPKGWVLYPGVLRPANLRCAGLVQGFVWNISSPI